MEMKVDTKDRLQQTKVIDARLGQAKRRGLLYGLFVWSVAQGFGGRYVPGTSTDVGAAIIYSLLFGTLLVVDAGRFSLDAWIGRRWPGWQRVAELRVRS